MVGERLVDNMETKCREAWAEGAKRPTATIDLGRLQDETYIGWLSDWMKDRWKPDKPFGTFR